MLKITFVLGCVYASAIQLPEVTVETRIAEAYAAVASGAVKEAIIEPAEPAEQCDKAEAETAANDCPQATAEADAAMCQPVQVQQAAK
jgi:hypothetical protein